MRVKSQSNCFSLVLGGLLIVFASAGGAQADPGPRDFYGKDYAAAPQVSHEPLHGEVVQKPQRSQRDGEEEREKGSSVTGENGEGDIGPSDTAEKEAVAAMQRQGGNVQRKKRETVPSTTLLLFVNSKDKQHLRSVLKKAVDVARKNDAFLATIFQLGDYRNVPEELAATLHSFGVSIIPLPTLPEDLAITQSPAWVFRSQAGVQVVEGTLAIEQFYDSEGNFKEPANFVDQQPQPESPHVKK